MAYSKTSELIIKHLSFERTSLGFSSVKYFAETGQITGELYGRIKDMVDEALAETPDASENTLPIDIVKGSALKAPLTFKQAAQAMHDFGIAASKWLESEEYKKISDAVKKVS